MSNFIAVGNSEPTPDNLPEEIKKIINDGKREAGFNPDGTPMTTDNTQELDEILREVREGSWSMGLQNASLDQLHNKRDTDEAKQRLLDWHSKQIEAILDRLVDQQWSFGENDDALAIPIRYIEAERDKLKEGVMDKVMDNTPLSADSELRDGISSIVYGADWRTKLSEDAHLPQTEAIMEIVRKHELQAVRDYILSLGWQETDNEYVAEVLSDCDRIAEDLEKYEQ